MLLWTKDQLYDELIIKNKCSLPNCTVSEAQARVASVEAELKERSEQLESLQSQLKYILAEREQQLEESQNKEQNHNSEVRLNFPCPNTLICVT